MTAAPLPKIAFMHIPRTAGTGFGEMLETIYAGQPTRSFYVDETGSTDHALELFRSRPASEKNTFQVIRGHFPFEFDADLVGYKYITFLRDPVRRLVSYYYSILGDERNYLRQIIIQRRMSLADFLRSDVTSETDNFQVRALCGVTVKSRRRMVTEDELELAKANLQLKFAAFGLVERMDSSMDLLAEEVGRPLPQFPRKNSAVYPSSREAIPTEVAAECEAINAFDAALYRFAEQLFEERLSLLTSTKDGR